MASVSFIRTVDVKLPVRIQIVRGEGLTNLRTFSRENPDGTLHLSVESQLGSGSSPIGLSTRYSFSIYIYHTALYFWFRMF